MDFRFTEEQVMISDTAASFLAEVSSSESLRAACEPGGDRNQGWERIVTEMGWQALTIPERCGGLGLGYVELAIVQEAAGMRLLASPFYATVACGVSLLRVCADSEQQAAWLEPVANGEQTLALGLQSSGAAWGLPGCGLRYTTVDGGFALSGEVSYVVDGATADVVLVLALDAADDSPESARVFRIDGESEGLTRRSTPGMDQTRTLGQLAFTNVFIPETGLLANSRGGWQAIEPALDLASIALSAELLGVSQASLDAAVAYTQEREQFGRPIAGFQAIKHKAADMMLRSECARSALYSAACVADDYLDGNASALELADAASIAKASCGDCAFANAGEALQMHGGVGFTWEYDVHLYFKRARAGRAMQGSSDWHRERLAGFLLDQVTAA